MLNERNAFQQLMYYWAGVHPYNGIAIVRVEGPADLVRLRDALARVHERLGISRLVSHPRSYELKGSAADVPVDRICASGRDDDEALAERATLELNRPFEDGPALPVRLFVLPRGGYHYVGRTYQHWIGDASSMNALLCRVLSEYLGVNPPNALGADDPECPPFRRVFLTAAGPLAWCGHAGRLVRQWIEFRRCHRPRSGNPDDLTSQARLLALPDDVLPRLRRDAQRRG